MYVFQKEVLCAWILFRPEKTSRGATAAEKRLSDLKTMAIAFEQEKRLPLFKTPVRTKGCILYARPDRLRWEISSPFHSILMVAGDRVAKFEFVDGKRRTLELGRSADIILLVMDQIRGWLRGRFDRKGKMYRVTVSEKPTPLVVLKPIDRLLGKNLEAIELSMTPDLRTLTVLRIREAKGSVTTIRFTRSRREVEFAADTFSIENPPPIVIERLIPKTTEKEPANNSGKAKGEKRRGT